MGDRVSVSFKNGSDESVALFSHWGGFEFAKRAELFARDLVRSRTGYSLPLDRFEPSIVMVEFIRQVTEGAGVVESGLYLGRDEADGDNGDNGHVVIDMTGGKVRMYGGRRYLI